MTNQGIKFNFGLKKAERLTYQKSFDAVYTHGKVIYARGIRFLYLTSTLDASQIYPVQVAFITPKKLIRKATQRNKIKRKLKESYRLQKWLIYESCFEHKISIKLIIVSLHKKVHPYPVYYAALSEGLNQLVVLVQKDYSDAKLLKS